MRSSSSSKGQAMVWSGQGWRSLIIYKRSQTKCDKQRKVGKAFESNVKGATHCEAHARGSKIVFMFTDRE